LKCEAWRDRGTRTGIETVRRDEILSERKRQRNEKHLKIETNLRKMSEHSSDSEFSEELEQETLDEKRGSEPLHTCEKCEMKFITFNAFNRHVRTCKRDLMEVRASLCHRIRVFRLRSERETETFTA
jgi:hypothetical protein